MKNTRPVGNISGTTLIKSLDHYAVAHLAHAALKQIPDGDTEGYARGVSDALSWLAGSVPSSLLVELLDLEEEHGSHRR